MRELFMSTVSANFLGHSRRKRPECALPGCVRSTSLVHRVLRRNTALRLQGLSYCGPQCAEGALTVLLTQLAAIKPLALPPHRIPLGLLMVARGRLTYPEVSAALEAQRRARYGTIGDWFEKLGFATEQDVVVALGLQWGCPVAASLDWNTLPASCRIPWPILNTMQMLPLQYAATTKTLSLACGKRVDHTALYAIEKIIGCRTQPCVGARKAIAQQLECLRQQPRRHEVEFGVLRDPAEIGRTGLSYITRLGAQDVCITRVGQFIWMRLTTGSSFTDLTFALKTELDLGQWDRLLLASPSSRPATTFA